MRASAEQHRHCPEVPRTRHLWTMRVFDYLAYLANLANLALAYLCVLLTSNPGFPWLRYPGLGLGTLRYPDAEQSWISQVMVP